MSDGPVTGAWSTRSILLLMGVLAVIGLLAVTYGLSQQDDREVWIHDGCITVEMCEPRDVD